MDNCLPLDVWTDGAQCISCWRPSWRERLSILLFGRVWTGVHFGETQPPIWLLGKRDIWEGPEQPKKRAGFLWS